jgi:hypothetical protein
VAKLDRVPVPPAAHATSWLPGAQFAVLAAPTPQLIRVGGQGAEGALAGPEFATALTFARGQLAPDWVTGTLAPRWRVGAVQETQLSGDAARWWGTGKLVEFAAAIPDVSVLYQLVSSVRRDTCRWCSLELIGDRCAFCAAPALPPEPQPPLPPGPARAPLREAGRNGPRESLPTHYGNAVVADPRGL